ncbi:MAG: MFS transporter [Candidatus Uhrbacteria bacterium]
MNKDIYKYYLYSALSNFLFFLPIIYLFFKDSGLTFTQIFLTEAIFSVAVVLFEVPTGALADYIGRKKSVLAGVLMWILSCFIFFIGHSFITFSIANIFCALGVAFMSGADMALFYEILRKQNKENDYKKYQGTAQLIGLISLSLSALASGFISSIDLRLNFIASTVAFVLLFFIVVSIPSKEKEKIKGEEKPHYLKIITESFYLIKNSKWLLWLFVFSGIFGAAFKIIQPLTQIYMENSNLDIRYFGLASAYLFLMAALASKTADRFELFLKKWTYFVLTLLLIIPIFIISSFVFRLGFLVFGLVYLASAVSTITISHEILKTTPESKYATILSFKSLSYRGIFVIISPFFGYYLEVLNFREAMLIFGLFLSLIFSVVLISYLKIKKPDEPHRL